jgi:DNA-damage-inducible protein J
MSTINVRVDDRTKTKARELFSQFGLDLSTAINMFLMQSIREQGIPLDLHLHIPNSQTIKSIEETENGTGLSESFDNIEDLMEDLRA